MNALEKFDPVIAQINQIAEEGNFAPDCSTEEGYQRSKRFVLDITTKARKALESRHKEVKAPFAQAVKDIDSKKNELMEILKRIEEPHRLAYKEVDQAEKIKKQQFEDMLEGKIQELIGFRFGLEGLTSEELEDRVMSCGEIDTSEGFYHRGLDAAKEREESLRVLGEALNRREAFEQEQEQLRKDREELERLRSEQNANHQEQKIEKPISNLHAAQQQEATSIMLCSIAGITEEQAAKIIDAIIADQIPFLLFTGVIEEEKAA